MFGWLSLAISSSLNTFGYKRAYWGSEYYNIMGAPTFQHFQDPEDMQIWLFNDWQL